MPLEEKTSINTDISDVVSLLRGIGRDFDRDLLLQLIHERFASTQDVDHNLIMEVVILRLEKEHNTREISGLQQQIATQADQLLSMGNKILVSPSEMILIDSLTGLPNYNNFINDLLLDKNRSLVLFHINDMFRINTAFGRKTGDMVIQKIGKMLKNYALEYPNEHVSIYRFDGTTFAVVFHNVLSREHIQEKYERVRSIQIQDIDRSIPVSFSAGVALNAFNVHSMIHFAEQALKNSRKSKQIEFYNQERGSIDESEELFAMRRLVNEAFEKDLFEVYVQEIHQNPSCIRKSDKKKFECLVRMYDSEKKENLISPARFLPVVKKDGKNIDLTRIVIDKVCQMMVQDNHDYCINLTEDDLGLEGGANIIYEQFAAYGIDPDRVTCEVLEDVEELDLASIQSNLTIVRKLGFGIAIDDFGTGRSNFFRLTKIDVTSIKIDMQFIRGINLPTIDAQKNKSLIKFIIGYAHDNGLTVVAEGVETAEEQLVVETLGADYSQGYYFSKPRPYKLAA